MDLSNVTESFEHLAATCKARARMGQPLKGHREGVIWDVVEEEYFNDYDDEEVFDDEVLATFSDCGPPLGITEDEEERPERKDKRWSAKGYLISRDFSEIQDQMHDLTADGGVKKLVLREGTGRKVPTSGKVYYHYMIFVEGSEEPFDTTLIGKYPSMVDLRQARFPLLPGFHVALRSMELHEVAQFIINPEMAYGKAGCPPRIPENCKILFVAEIVHCIGEELLNTAPYMTAEERSYLPFETILKEAEKLMTMGNGHYENGNFNYAIRKYRKARCMLEDYPTQNEKDGKSRSFWSRKLCINIAQSYIRSERAPQACVACKLGLKECEEDDAEAVEFFWRFAKAKLMLKDAEAAKGLIDQAYKISPDNLRVKKLREEIYKVDKIQDTGYKAMCRRMFGNGGSKRPNTFTSKPSSSQKQISTPVSDREAAPLQSDNSNPPTNQPGCAMKSEKESATSVTAKNLPNSQPRSQWTCSRSRGRMFLPSNEKKKNVEKIEKTSSDCQVVEQKTSTGCNPSTIPSESECADNKKTEKNDMDVVSTISTAVKEILVDDDDIDDDDAELKYKKELMKTFPPMFFETFEFSSADNVEVET